MRNDSKYKKVNKNNLIFILSVFLTIYFSYHLVFSDRSYVKYVELQNSKSEILSELEYVSNNRKYLETRVKKLRPASLDKDLLEERVHLILGYGSSKDVILFR